MASIWIQLGEENRVVGLRFEEPPEADLDLWEPHDFPEEHYHDHHLWRLVGRELVYDPSAEHVERQRRAERSAVVAEALAGLPELSADTDAAICELYEAQEDALASVDAAICELYEMLAGGEA